MTKQRWKNIGQRLQFWKRFRKQHDGTRSLLPKDHDGARANMFEVSGATGDWRVMGGCAVACVLTAYFIWTRRRRSKSKTASDSTAKKVPYGPGVMEFARLLKYDTIPRKDGHLGSAAFPIRHQPTHSTDAFQLLRSKYGSIYRLVIPFVTELVVTTDLTSVRDLLVKKNNNYRSSPTLFTRSQLHSGTLGLTIGRATPTIVNPADWKWRRESLLREFHKTRLFAPPRQLVQYVVQATQDHLLAPLQRAAECGTTISLQPLTVHVTSSVIFFFLLGHRVEYPVREFSDAALFLLDYFRYRLRHRLDHVLLQYVPGTKAHEMETLKIKAWKLMDSIMGAHVERIVEEEEEEAASLGKPSESPLARPALASMFAREPRYLDQPNAKERLVEETRVLVQAGFETTSNALAFALGILAERPDLADLLAAEAQRVFNPLPTREGLEAANVSRGVFLEAVRLYPLVSALVGTVGPEDVVVETDDPAVHYKIPAGIPVLFPTQAMHTDPKYGTKDPWQVDIHRWDADNPSPPPLLSFGLGAHACPGRNLAILEAQITLLMVARRFRLELEEPHKDDEEVEAEEKKEDTGKRTTNKRAGTNLQHEEVAFLRPKNGLRVRVRDRTE